MQRKTAVAIRSSRTAAKAQSRNSSVVAAQPGSGSHEEKKKKSKGSDKYQFIVRIEVEFEKVP